CRVESAPVSGERAASTFPFSETFCDLRGQIRTGLVRHFVGEHMRRQVKMAKQISIAALVAVCISLMTLAPQPLWGQAVYGGVIGTVTDPQGAAVANAKVTVTDEGKGTSVTTTT